MALLWPWICVAEISDFSMDAIDIAMTCYDTHISISSGSAKVYTEAGVFYWEKSAPEPRASVER